MAFVITRLCQNCVDGSCVTVCPKDCILEHRAKAPSEKLPNQLFINPEECIDCAACVPECPWEAIYHEADVPPIFNEDIALNATTVRRSEEFVIPVERLIRKPSTEEVEANKRRAGL